MLRKEQLSGVDSQAATPPKSLPLKNAILVSNPLAGIRSARRSSHIHKAVAILRSAGIAADLQFTSGPGDGKQIANAAVKQGCELVIACGGDGTINEIINGLAPSQVPLAILPGGTANIVAKELGLPGGIVKAARGLPSWRPCRVALGRASWQESGSTLQRYFMAVAGVGFDARIISQLDVAMKLRMGVVAYVWEAVRQVFQYGFPPFRCEIDGSTVSVTFAVVQRSSRYAGWLRLARPHSIHQPDFSCCLFAGASPKRYFRYALGILTQTHRRLIDVYSPAGSSVRCLSGQSKQPIYFEVDGELTGKIPVTFEIVPDALTILAPDSFFKPTTGPGAEG